MAVNKNPLYAILKRLTDCWRFMGSFVVALVYRTLLWQSYHYCIVANICIQFLIER